MSYTIGEMAKRLGVAPSTLRYYDKEGLLPFVERSGGIRMFKEEDYEWLMIIKCLKKTGMPLCDIREFVMMAMEGDNTIKRRLALINKQKESIERQLDELSSVHRVLEFKKWYYETAQKEGSTQIPKNMTSDELPTEFREIRKMLRGE